LLLASDHHLLAVTDQLFLVEKLQRAVPFRVDGISKATVNLISCTHRSPLGTRSIDEANAGSMQPG
jgi:hypothetical protein